MSTGRGPRRFEQEQGRQPAHKTSRHAAWTETSNFAGTEDEYSLVEQYLKSFNDDTDYDMGSVGSDDSLDPVIMPRTPGRSPSPKKADPNEPDHGLPRFQIPISKRELVAKKRLAGRPSTEETSKSLGPDSTSTTQEKTKQHSGEEVTARNTTGVVRVGTNHSSLSDKEATLIHGSDNVSHNKATPTAGSGVNIEKADSSKTMTTSGHNSLDNEAGSTLTATRNFNSYRRSLHMSQGSMFVDHFDDDMKMRVVPGIPTRPFAYVDGRPTMGEAVRDHPKASHDEIYRKNQHHRRHWKSPQQQRRSGSFKGTTRRRNPISTPSQIANTTAHGNAPMVTPGPDNLQGTETAYTHKESGTLARASGSQQAPRQQTPRVDRNADMTDGVNPATFRQVLKDPPPAVTPGPNAHAYGQPQNNQGATTKDHRESSSRSSLAPGSMFGDIYAKFIFDVRDLEDCQHVNADMMLEMENALAFAYSETLQDQAKMMDLHSKVTKGMHRADDIINRFRRFY